MTSSSKHHASWTEKFTVPAEALPAIIGKGGTNVAKARSVSGVLSINIPSKGDIKGKNATITITGSKDACLKARMSLEETLPIEKPMTVKWEFHQKIWDSLKDIRTKTDVFVVMPDKGAKAKSTILLRGPKSRIAEAEKMINSLLPKSEEVTIITVPHEFHSIMVGKGGSTKSSIESKSGAMLSFPEVSSKSDDIRIAGSSKQVALAMSQISVLVDKLSRDTFGETRKEASKVADARSKYFNDAKAAFDKGDAARGRELLEKAKAETANLRAANARAAQATFAEKNKGNSQFVIDLHGQMEAEALEIMEARLRMLSKSSASKGKTLTVIHGKGNHSEGAALIKPGVYAWLKRNKYSFSDVDGGSVAVRL